MQENNLEVEDLDMFEKYGYKPGQEVLIDAEFLIGVLSFCERVDAQQPKLAVPLQYPKNSFEIKDKDSGELLRVDVDWAEHTSRSFANTAFSESGAVPVMTELGLFSFQIQEALYKYHKYNIKNGVAVKLTEE